MIDTEGKGILQEKAQEMEPIFALGITDVWKEFFDPDEDVGGEIQCVTLSGFLLYLCSETTYGVRVEKLVKTTRFCVLQVIGPKCAKHGRLYVQYELSSTYIKNLFTEEIAQLRQALKKHVRRQDPEFHEPGTCEGRELFRVLRLPY